MLSGFKSLNQMTKKSVSLTNETLNDSIPQFQMTEIPVNNAVSVKVIESERDLRDVFQRHVLIKVPINMKK